MSPISLAALAAAAAASPHSHDVTVEHRGVPVELNYRAETTISHRQLGAVSPPGVASSRRCAWTATVTVERIARRAGADVPALTRQLPHVERLSGTRPGACDTASEAIATEVAARAPEVQAHLIEVAERDRTDVLAEIDSVGNLG